MKGVPLDLRDMLIAVHS